MKNLSLIVIPLMILFFQSCRNTCGPMKPCTYELSGPQGKDTINMTYDGKKQGIWISKTKTYHAVKIHAKDTVIFKGVELVKSDTIIYKNGIAQK